METREEKHLREKKERIIEMSEQLGSKEWMSVLNKMDEFEIENLHCRLSELINGG